MMEPLEPTASPRDKEERAARISRWSTTNGDRYGRVRNQGRGRWSPVLPKRFYHSSKQHPLDYFTRYVRQNKNTHKHTTFANDLWYTAHSHVGYKTRWWARNPSRNGQRWAQSKHLKWSVGGERNCSRDHGGGKIGFVVLSGENMATCLSSKITFTNDTRIVELHIEYIFACRPRYSEPARWTGLSQIYSDDAFVPISLGEDKKTSVDSTNSRPTWRWWGWWWWWCSCHRYRWWPRRRRDDVSSSRPPILIHAGEGRRPN